MECLREKSFSYLQTLQTNRLASSMSWDHITFTQAFTAEIKYNEKHGEGGESKRSRAVCESYCFSNLFFNKRSGFKSGKNLIFCPNACCQMKRTYCTLAAKEINFHNLQF